MNVLVEEGTFVVKFRNWEKESSVFHKTGKDKIGKMDFDAVLFNFRL